MVWPILISVSVAPGSYAFCALAVLSDVAPSKTIPMTQFSGLNDFRFFATTVFPPAPILFLNSTRERGSRVTVPLFTAFYGRTDAQRLPLLLKKLLSHQMQE